MTERPARAALVVAALSLSLALGSTGVAAAAERKKVAVLEYRAGVEQAPLLAQRLAERLSKLSSLTVIDPQEARRRVSRVDHEVARCSGEAVCISAIGTKLDVDEVLLVGVSSLGDVVVALQRIDIPLQSVGPHLADSLDQNPSDEKIVAWLKQLYPPEVFRRYGYINVTANVEGAQVTINGQDRGTTPLDGKVKVVAPRSYRVSLEKKGFGPFGARIDVPPDATVDVHAELSPKESALAWYKRWYLWAAVGGAVAIAGVVGLVVATRPDDQHVTGIIMKPLGF